MGGGEKMRRALLATVAAFSLGGCYAHGYAGPDGRPYRHERRNGEEVYLREDGHWYARRNDQWVSRPYAEEREEREEQEEREERREQGQ